MFRTVDGGPARWVAYPLAFIPALAAALILCPVPPKMLFTIPRLLGTLLWYVPLPWAIAGLVLRLVGGKEHGAASSALWFGPILIALRAAPEWAAAGVALWTLHFTSAVTREGPGESRWLALPAALSLQATVGLSAVGWTGWAAVVAVVPAVLLAWGFFPYERRWLRPVAALVLMLLALIPMGSYLERPVAGGGGPQFPARAEMPREGREGSRDPAEVHRGVILWPPKRESVKLVAPRPRESQPVFDTRQAKLLRIPFNGVYWLFQPPFSRPPVNSVVEHGLPTERSYRSTGGLSMLMEAHQHLGTMVETSCCRQIEVEILNADPFGNETFLELVLWDTSMKSKPWVSLGMMPVVERPRFGAAATTEVLTFPLKMPLRIAHFDAVSVRFHQTPSRRTRNVKAAVQAFTFVPRLR